LTESKTKEWKENTEEKGRKKRGKNKKKERERSLKYESDKEKKGYDSSVGCKDGKGINKKNTMEGYTTERKTGLCGGSIAVWRN